MDKKAKLEKIAQEIASCQACPLAKTATRPVPGNGDSNPEIMLIGEAPGYWEDQKGIPFVGPAGKLLDELLASINLNREKVFTTNVVKHRPPGNRDPLPEEIKACQPFLERQIEVIGPKVIITLGRFAFNYFVPLGKISRDHGKARLIEYKGRRLILIPMFHPAAALRQAEIEKELREDFKKIPIEIKKLERNIVTEGKTPEKVEEQLKLV